MQSKRYFPQRLGAPIITGVLLSTSSMPVMCYLSLPPNLSCKLKYCLGPMYAFALLILTSCHITGQHSILIKSCKDTYTACSNKG